MATYQTNVAVDFRNLDIWNLNKSGGSFSGKTGQSYNTNFWDKTSISVRGSGFTYDPLAGFPLSGTTHEIKYYGSGLISTLSGIRITIAEEAVFFDKNDIRYVLNRIFSGSDSITGSSGNDYIDGFAGADTLAGGAGNDTYIVDHAADRVIEARGRGNDKVVTSVSYALPMGQEIETLTTDAPSGKAAIDLTGNEFANSLLGNAGANVLRGGGGKDVLDGGAGLDTADYGDKSSSVVVALKTSTAVTVTVGGLAEDTISNIENVIGGSASDHLTGDANANILDGRGGADHLAGGAGNDTYVVNHAGDRVVEAKGQGRDVLVATLSYALGAGQEVEVLQFSATTGAAALNLTGNEFGQTLIGNSGSNILDGGLGNDLLTGGRGADSFVFSTALGANNVDRISDFAAEDTIRLDDAIFRALAPGQLAAGAFKNLDTGKADADDRILYNQKTGDLWYDADGSGKAAGVKFAVLDNKAALTAADFLVV